MGVSARHTMRILAAYRQEGAAALAHGNRGRRPANATPETMATHVVHLARTRYAESTMIPLNHVNYSRRPVASPEDVTEHFEASN